MRKKLKDEENERSRRFRELAAEADKRSARAGRLTRISGRAAPQQLSTAGGANRCPRRFAVGTFVRHVSATGGRRSDDGTPSLERIADIGRTVVLRSLGHGSKQRAEGHPADTRIVPGVGSRINAARADPWSGAVVCAFCADAEGLLCLVEPPGDCPRSESFTRAAPTDPSHRAAVPPSSNERPDGGESSREDSGGAVQPRPDRRPKDERRHRAFGRRAQRSYENAEPVKPAAAPGPDGTAMAGAAAAASGTRRSGARARRSKVAPAATYKPDRSSRP